MDTMSLIHRVEMFSVNFVTFSFCKLLLWRDSLKNVADVNAFK